MREVLRKTRSFPLLAEEKGKNQAEGENKDTDGEDEEQDLHGPGAGLSPEKCETMLGLAGLEISKILHGLPDGLGVDDRAGMMVPEIQSPAAQ